jgi:hypothetical protein
MLRVSISSRISEPTKFYAGLKVVRAILTSSAPLHHRLRDGSFCNLALYSLQPKMAGDEARSL